MRRRYHNLSSWRDATLTPLVELGLVSLGLWVAHWGRLKWSLGPFLSLLIFLFVLISTTLVFLFLLRGALPLREGLLTLESNPWTLYWWRLHTFLCTTNLVLFYKGGLLPPFLRKLFYRLLGGKISKECVLIAGQLYDPYLIKLEDNVLIGHDAVLIAHDYSLGKSAIVILGRIEIRHGAVIGARSVLMPGATIGEDAVVRPMSFVPLNAKIPPREIWGGVPAKKIGTINEND